MSDRPAVRSFFHAPTGSWSHLAWDPGCRVAAIVDPVLDFDAPSGRTGSGFPGAIRRVAAAEGLEVRWILETHAHADHLSAAGWLAGELGAPVCIGEGICQVQARFRGVYNLGESFPADGRQFDRLLADGDALPLGDLEIRVLATPGHTGDSVTYVVGDAAFIGDTLFAPDYGTARCDFPGGDAATLYRSIRRLYGLPGATRLFLCHDYPPEGREPLAFATVGEQRRANIHLADGVDEAAFVAMRVGRDAGLSMPALILPAIQVNIRAGRLPEPEANGIRYLRLPLDAL